MDVKVLNAMRLIWAIFGLLLVTAPARAEWALAIHGGAGVIERARLTPAKDAEIRAALTKALEAGGAVLAKGGSALDAVEAAARILEDDPNFNAGKGAVFSAEGRNELDASIMDGRTRAAGAVAGVTRTKNPISLARRVMEKSPHVMLAGVGADAFSLEQGLEQVDPSYFRTEERWRQLQELKQTAHFDAELKYGTVGAVARDAAGHIAAATSTGGLTMKRWGRVGDSPIIGAGTYADDRGCAVSGTGSGEHFIRLGVAHEICARVRMKGESVKAAADAVVAELGAIGASGGVIIMGADGPGGFAFNSPGMYRGRISGGRAAEAMIYGDEGRER